MLLPWQSSPLGEARVALPAQFSGWEGKIYHHTPLTFQEEWWWSVVNGLETGTRHPGLKNNEIARVLKSRLLPGTLPTRARGPSGVRSLIFSLSNNSILPREHTSVENSEKLPLYTSLFSIQSLAMRIFITRGKLEKTWPSEGEKSLLLLAKPR